MHLSQSIQYLDDTGQLSILLTRLEIPITIIIYYTLAYKSTVDFLPNLWDNKRGTIRRANSHVINRIPIALLSSPTGKSIILEY